MSSGNVVIASRPASVSAWRMWAQHASPELLELFDRGSLARLQCVRRRYPSDITPDHHAYQLMKHDCTAALDELAGELEEKNCAVD